MNGAQGHFSANPSGMRPHAFLHNFRNCFLGLNDLFNVLSFYFLVPPGPDVDKRKMIDYKRASDKMVIY